MAKSIGRLHSEVTASAAQFIAEYERADNASRRRNASIRAEMSKTADAIRRQFTMPNLAKGLMSGMGIGSGIMVAQTAANKLGEALRSNTEHARDMAEYVERMRDALEEASRKRFERFVGGLPDGVRKVEAFDQRAANLREELRKAEDAREFARSVVRDAGFNLVSQTALDKFSGGKPTTSGALMKAAQADIDKQDARVSELKDQLADADVARTRAQAEHRKAFNESFNRQIKPFNDGVEQASKRLEAAAEKMRSAIETPGDRLAGAIVEASELLERGKITKPEGDAAIARTFKQFEEDTDPSKSPDYKRWARAAGELKVDDMTRRGLGTGGGYAEANQQTASILGRIEELIKNALRGPGRMPSIAATGIEAIPNAWAD